MNQDTRNELLTYDEDGKPKLPSGLNVLTILTFVGCAIFGLLTLASPAINKFFLSLLDKAASSGQELSAKQVADMEKGRAALELAKQNLIPVMVLGMVGIVLCFIGALWMRKFKKDGYWIYVAGHIVPLLGGLLVMGTAQYNGVFSVLIAVGVPLVFIVLYTMQRKYLYK